MPRRKAKAIADAADMVVAVMSEIMAKNGYRFVFVEDVAA